MTTERELLASIQAALAREPDVWAMRNTVGAGESHGRYQTYGLGKGSPDIVAVLAPWGHWICLEVKTKTGRVRKDQQRWMTLARRVGMTVAVVRSGEEALSLVQQARELCASPRYTESMQMGPAPADAAIAARRGNTR